jgi:hypothetical protein
MKNYKTFNNKLVDRIYTFINKYANLNPNWDSEFDDEEDKFTSPDASMLKYCADMIKIGVVPDHCWSEWSSGGYSPYISKKGRLEHDEIIKDIYKIIRK